MSLDEKIAAKYAGWSDVHLEWSIAAIEQSIADYLWQRHVEPTEAEVLF